MALPKSESHSKTLHGSNERDRSVMPWKLDEENLDWLPKGEQLDSLLDSAKKYIDGKETPPMLVERYYKRIDTPDLTYLVHSNHLILTCLPL